jgi:hypothetical protein
MDRFCRRDFECRRELGQSTILSGRGELQQSPKRRRTRHIRRTTRDLAAGNAFFLRFRSVECRGSRAD